MDEPSKGGASIVTLECASILPSSEAAEVVIHIEGVWQRGKDAIDALRAALGPDLRQEKAQGQSRKGTSAAKKRHRGRQEKAQG